ncbi:hypothetical protein [Nitrogeniibacter aestuarii]|uniref:hypothetical protein n=1 Tax=Nitrogeniibacter aestuarii TaxID=2815343 RepID=UPI001E5A90BA|nr:hypothetical protein [Nitrogeniibacter aestuarii]
MYYTPELEITDADLTLEQALTVSLSNIGNPDHGQNPSAPLPGTRDFAIDAKSLKHASTLCRKYIWGFGLGAGNWTGGAVFDSSGTQIAQISYNGRVWKVPHADSAMVSS